MKPLTTLIALFYLLAGMAQNHTPDFKTCCKETHIQAGCKSFCHEYLRSLDIEKLFEMHEHSISPANVDKWGTGGSDRDFSLR